MTNTQVRSEMMTIEQVAIELNVSASWVRKHKEIPRHKFGKSVRIKRADVADYVQKQRMRTD